MIVEGNTCSVSTEKAMTTCKVPLCSCLLAVGKDIFAVNPDDRQLGLRAVAKHAVAPHDGGSQLHSALALAGLLDGSAK
jgi:hypothetical protein